MIKNIAAYLKELLKLLSVISAHSKDDKVIKVERTVRDFICQMRLMLIGCMKCTKKKKLPPVSYEYYRKIFDTRFNIVIGYPRSDTCSSCDKYQADVTVLQYTLSGPSLPHKEKHKLEMPTRTAQMANKVHKHKAEVFYERKRTARQRSMKNESHEAITFYFQKNLPMPKLTTNCVYYRRQLSLYSFDIHTSPRGHSVFYCYPETEGRKGSVEVTSFLHHFIFNLPNPKVKVIELFYDVCAEQNKNYTVLRFLYYDLHAARRLDHIKLTFPVCGHSHLECDRSMVLINQKYPAELPEHWVKVFETARTKPSPCHVVNVDQALLRNWTQYLTSL
ncbi:hypothetical protein PR048_027472 [Dryococelus australis]|uniref:Uncharacterized protein n=1 Tax=Dryococelus australis TaxID=614101 RepID=A0ABQ9GGF3_9NEOP|nr:hypothetical protein PR048_027472 [Dryococelus australis]